MNHQPFEEWLLNDKNLTPTEKRDLNLHLRTCTHCTALSATGLALRSANVAAPAAGFSMRFQQRLAAQKIAERRRKLWGMLVLILGGAGLLGWFAAPYFYTFISAPVEWITVIIGYFLFAVTSLQALTEVVSVMIRIVADFMPPYVWMVLVSALAGFGLLWIISIWRFSNRAPQGVSA
ncbi:MAG: hypothetical protein HY864_02195 [Chloroflexi bacterium]|nr:hypothetical protein [Chloroflexota bacterium]